MEAEKQVADYCNAVLLGTRVAGKLEVAAVQRYLEDVAQIDAPDFPYEFSTEKALSACEFFSLLIHTDGEYSGRQFVLYPWQTFVVWQLFGWVRKDNGLRRFRELFLSVGRGNGKTPFGAAIALLLFAFDSPQEDRAEGYTAAVKRDQASLAFDAIRRFVERSGLLRSGYIQSLKTAVNIPRLGSTLKPLSSDAKSADGLNIHVLLRDELHAWTDYQREFYEKLQTALGKRRQPVAITITTAGSEESTLWLEQYNLARKVVERGNGVDVDSLLVSIFEIDDDDDELSPEVWPKANPMLEFGVVKRKYLEDLAAKSVIDPSFRHQFRRYHGNKLTFSHHKTFTAELWAKGDQPIPWSECRRNYAGVDLGWCDDLAAVGYCFPLDWVSVEGTSKRRYAVMADAFCPRGGRRDLTREPFRTWVNLKKLHITESEWTDTEPIYDLMKRRAAEFGAPDCTAYDPNNMREFALNLTNALKFNVFPFGQKHVHYHEPLKEFKIALAEGRILHGGEPLLGWAASNVVEDENAAGHRMPAKSRSIDKIDPFVAVLMAFSQALFAERKAGSVYERRGVRTIEI